MMSGRRCGLCTLKFLESSVLREGHYWGFRHTPFRTRLTLYRDGCQHFSGKASIRQISTQQRITQPRSNSLLLLLSAFGVGGFASSIWHRPHAQAESVQSQNDLESPLSTSSTLPLDAVPPASYATSSENLRGALDEFTALLGPENVSTSHGERVARSSTEWSRAPRGELDAPSMIVYPRSTPDVSEIAKICHRRRIPMIAFCGGTSLEGTLAAQNNEVCVDFNKHMGKILAIRKDDLDVTVQPSVGYVELNQALAEHGLFFPPDPGPGAQIGGMVAQGCSGTNAYRYGTMKDWVLGLTVVLADGTVIKTRHRPRKSSSGYDMTRLFVGSEGTLGFVTEVSLKLTKAPQNVTVAVAQFSSIRDTVSVAVSILQSGHQLEAMEMLDEEKMRGINLSGYCDREWPEKPTLFFKLAGTPSQVAEQAQIVQQQAERFGCLSFRLAKDAEESDNIWYARKTALWSGLALKKDPSDEFLSADACVPISRLSDLIEKSREYLKDCGMQGAFIGHVGDGELSFP